MKVAKVLLKVPSAVIATIFYIAEEYNDSAQAGLIGVKIVGSWEEVKIIDSADEIRRKLL